MSIYKIQFGGGWYGEEHDGVRAFRWMGRQADGFLKDISSPAPKYLMITAEHPFKDPPRLEVFAGAKKIGEKTIAQAATSYLFPFEDVGNVTFSFRLDRTHTVPGDPRELGILAKNAAVVVPAELREPLYLEGWYDWEDDQFSSFRWISEEALILIPPGLLANFKYLTLPVFSEFLNLSQVLSVSVGKNRVAEISLLNRWNYYSIPLRPDSILHQTLRGDAPLQNAEENAASPFELRLRLNKLFPAKYHSGDGRRLGARIGPLAFHNDDVWHKNFVFFHANALLNYQEMTEGKSMLRSYPLSLGIDLYGKCNIKPPCVYCLWDKMKVIEGEEANVDVNKETFEGYGPFFHGARTLVNCSFGEPLLHPQFEEILDFFAANKKILELSTNGQAFTERTIRALIGKPIYLYVSLDAATKETYAKIRNDRWDSIVANLVRLNELRKKAENFPKIYMVFMPMRVNRNDLEEYFKLCRKIDADALVLRPLLYLWDPKIEADRGGYHFDYAREMLSREEAEEIISLAERYSKTYNILLANQYNFGEITEPGKDKG